MANTTNFGWETPDDTDLVKDGAAAMRTLGNAIDASLVDLKGGTTGQVLSKATNTDMDFTWVTTDDANAIQNAIVDAKGDLIAASAADTPARLAVGNNGDTLVADSSATTGLRWQGNYAAGKNKIINGDFGIWQRGTSFTSQTFGTYYADRWCGGADGGGTRTISQQTFTPGTAPMAGYEGTFFLRNARSVAGSGSTYDVLDQRVEDVRTFAGQTMTFSFWAKADATRSVSIGIEQIYGSGGSATTTATGSTFSLTTSWARYSFTTSIPSISGKTIGTNSYLNLRFVFPLNTTFTIDIWGVQAEASNTATAFQTATGTLAGELQAAQRYYYKSYNQTVAPGTAFSEGEGIYYATGINSNTNVSVAAVPVHLPVTMRTSPTIAYYDRAGTIDRVTGIAYNSTGTNGVGPLNAVYSRQNMVIFRAFNVAYTGFELNFTATSEL